MTDASITPTDKGPYLVQGNVSLLDAEGNPYEVGDTIALCRCGLSSTKPFCDGAHETANFSAVNRALPRVPGSIMAPAAAGAPLLPPRRRLALHD